MRGHKSDVAAAGKRKLRSAQDMNAQLLVALCAQSPTESGAQGRVLATTP